MSHIHFMLDQAELQKKRGGDEADQIRRGMLLGALLYAAQPALAQRLLATQGQMEGPFHPDRQPFDQDNDLTMVAGHHAPAPGKITDLTVRILDVHGKPLHGLVIEIWQVANDGHYIHTADAGARNDANFQGFGHFETGQDGAYRFRTINPAP